MREFLTFLRRNTLALVGFVILILMVALIVVGPWVIVYSPTKLDILHKLAAPSASHWLGTDAFGRDVLTRIMYGGAPRLRSASVSLPSPLSSARSSACWRASPAAGLIASSCGSSMPFCPSRRWFWQSRCRQLLVRACRMPCWLSRSRLRRNLPASPAASRSASR